MEVRKLAGNLLHVLIVLLRLHLVEIHVHVRLAPRLRFLHDRGEAEPAAEVGSLRYLQAVQVFFEEVGRGNECLGGALEIEEAEHELHVGVSQVERLLFDVG